MNTADESNYQSGNYWRQRSDMLYYRYIDYIMRCVSVSAQSMIDVGTGNCPYLEWFDWIPERVSVDIRIPYQSDQVKGVKGDIFEMSFDQPFDICTCLQVLEHVPEADRFARRLLELGKLVIVSVPYNWEGGTNQTSGHIHDPVDYEKLTGWMGRPANYHLVVEEPFGQRKHKRLIALYDRNPDRKFTTGLRNRMIMR